MRRRPKLNAAIADALAAHFRGNVGNAAESLPIALEEAGYDIIEKATRRRERRLHSIADLERDYAQREIESVRSWALGIAEEERRLRDRCSFLYTTAEAHGVPKEALRGE